MSLRLFPVIGASDSADRTATLMPPFYTAIGSSTYTALCGEVTIDALLDGTVAANPLLSGTLELQACP